MWDVMAGVVIGCAGWWLIGKGATWYFQLDDAPDTRRFAWYGPFAWLIGWAAEED